VTPTFGDGSSRRKKEATIEAIINAAGDLLAEKMGSAPHAREIAAKSGYSVGTIYNYFTSVGDVVSHLVLKRQTDSMKAIEAILLAHPADQPVDILCAKIVESIFGTFRATDPAVLRFSYKLAVSQSAKPEQHERVVDILVQPIHDAVRRDRTGTFRICDDQELTLYLRGIAYLCRYPLLEASALYGTPDHRRIILNFMIQAMSQPARREGGRPLEPPAA